jgi:hydrogenase maturation protease
MQPPLRLAVIGIGNTLAGDDGAGIRVIGRLRELLDGKVPGDVLLDTLEGDLLEVTGMLDRVGRFVFVDAVAGAPPGRIEFSRRASRAFAPSFHQTDIGTLMTRLEGLGMADPYPDWEVAGITIEPPRTLGEGLSPAVGSAVEELARILMAAVVPGEGPPD